MIINSFGARGFLSDLFGVEGKDVRMRDSILAARDTYLANHGLIARPGPTEEPEQQVDDFGKAHHTDSVRGWSVRTLIDPGSGSPGYRTGEGDRSAPVAAVRPSL